MNNFKYILLALMAISTGAWSCSNQRYASGEVDDIYYSSSDRYAESPVAQVEDIDGDDYQSEFDDASNDYYSVGKEQSQTQYRSGDSTQQSGQTINNFYGNTNYYEGDQGYFDDSYATRIRRFNTYGTAVAYSYYDPFFMDPFWNYGVGYWNPYPYSGWGVGYNSWGGWNFSYRVGYMPWYRQPLWYRYGGNYAYWDYWSYGYPGYAFNPYYGGGYWGGGYWNGYNNGYNNGYYNGFNDGYYSGWNNDLNNGRERWSGRNPSAVDRGFSNDGRGGRASSGSVDKVASSPGQVASNQRASMKSSSDDQLMAQSTGIRSSMKSNDIYQLSDARKPGSGTGTVADSRRAEMKAAAQPAAQPSKYRVAGNTPTSTQRSSASSGQSNDRVSAKSRVSSPQPASVKTRTSTSYAGSSRASMKPQSEQRASAPRNNGASTVQNDSRSKYNSGSSQSTQANERSSQSQRNYYNDARKPASSSSSRSNYQSRTKPSSSSTYGRSSTTTRSSSSSNQRRSSSYDRGQTRSKTYSAPSQSRSRSKSYSAPSQSRSKSYSAPSSSSRSSGRSAPAPSSVRSSSGGSAPAARSPRSTGGRR